MRRLAISILLLAGCLQSPPAEAPLGEADASLVDARIAPDLVLWLKMDDALDDGFATDTAGGHQVSCTGHCPTAVEAQIGGGYQFAGSAVQTYLTLADDESLRLRAGTVAAWVYLATLDNHTVFSKPFGIGSDNSVGLFYLIGSGVYFEVGDQIIESGVGPIPIGEWIHLAATWDEAAGARRLFLDGEEIGSGADFSMDFDDHPFLIGKESDNETLVASLEGLLDDLQLFSRALAPEEIEALYTEGA